MRRSKEWITGREQIKASSLYDKNCGGLTWFTFSRAHSSSLLAIIKLSTAPPTTGFYLNSALFNSEELMFLVLLRANESTALLTAPRLETLSVSRNKMLNLKKSEAGKVIPKNVPLSGIKPPRHWHWVNKKLK